VVVAQPPTVTVFAPAPAPAPVPSGRGSGDLGLAQPIANVPCAGGYLTLISSAINPDSYQSEVQNLLNTYPGSSYLKTGASCSALTQLSDQGTDIYAVYFGPFSSASQACANRPFESANVRAMQNLSPSDAAVDC